MNQVEDILELQRDLERYQDFVKSVRNTLNDVLEMDLPDNIAIDLERLLEKTGEL
jgi:hypothetical protein